MTSFLDGGNDTQKTLEIKQAVFCWFWNRARARLISPEANRGSWVVDLLAVSFRGKWEGIHQVEVKITKSDFRRDLVTVVDVKDYRRRTKEMKEALKCLISSARREVRIRVGGYERRRDWSRWRGLTDAERRYQLGVSQELSAWNRDPRFEHAMEVYGKADRALGRQRVPKVKFMASEFIRRVDYTWIAAPTGLIRVNELPPGFGLLEVKRRSPHGGDHKARVKVAAPLIEQDRAFEDRWPAFAQEIARKNTQLLCQQAGGEVTKAGLVLPEKGDHDERKT